MTCLNTNASTQTGSRIYTYCLVVRHYGLPCGGQGQRTRGSDRKIRHHRGGPAVTAHSRCYISQPRVNRFAFQSQHAEGAFVYTVERLAFNKTLKAFYAQGKLSKRKRPLVGEASTA